MRYGVKSFNGGRRFCAVLIGALLLCLCAPDAPARTICFAGREWSVRTGTGGPGPNKWSDSAESVWVDDAGLHLKIRKIGDAWHCAEITSVEPARHGMHRFYVASRVDLLDRNIVASPFLYQDDSHEVDIEFSKWQSASGKGAQYVVQPYDTPGNRRRFDIGLNGDCSTHCFNWLPHSIQFRSFHGHHPEPPAGSSIQEWTYTGGDNPAGNEGLRIHVNFWLIKGAPPSDGREAEFIIKDADLPPLSGASPIVPANAAPDAATSACPSAEPARPK